LVRRYETILLFDIDAGEEARNAFISRSKSLIEDYKGELLEQDEWGVRKLAYEVRKKTRGYYVRLDYYASTELIAEYERIIRLEDSVMKYITVMINEAFDPDAYTTAQAQMAQATEEEESAGFSESVDMNESSDQDDISENDENDSEMSDDSYNRLEASNSDDSKIDLSIDSDFPDNITEEPKKED